MRIVALIGQKIFDYRLNKKGHLTFGKENKYIIHMESGIPVDVFTTTPENWGMALFVRTGPADFNKRAFTRFKQLGKRGHAYGGVEDAQGKEWAVPEENLVFAHLGVDPIAPEERR